jgi:hypothetical protein
MELRQFVQERRAECASSGIGGHASRRLLATLSFISFANLVAFTPGLNLFPDNPSHCLGVCISVVNAGALGFMASKVFGDPIRRRLNNYFLGNSGGKETKRGNCDK